MKQTTPIVVTREEYERLINPTRKGKPRRKRKRAEPVYCPACGERITSEDSTSNPVENGHATPHHLWCYCNSEKKD